VAERLRFREYDVLWSPLRTLFSFRDLLSDALRLQVIRSYRSLSVITIRLPYIRDVPMRAPFAPSSPCMAFPLEVKILDPL